MNNEFFIIKDACEKTLTGTQCHWDGTTCKIKTCTNAGSSYAGHDQCTTFMPTCTANGATGCTDRTCTNAPTTNNTNDLCKAYHPTGNCVTKNGGGCRTNSTCEAIDLEAACVADLSGKTCFWDGACKTKICTNSPTSNNTHALCSAFLPSCTAGSGSTCVDKTCENIQAEADCTTDLNSKACTYKGKCYQKQCALASKSITTHSDCQAYHPTCTLDNTGTGCMTLPLRCEAITQTTACVIKAGGGKCGLQGNSCVDQTCATAPAGSTYTTTTACNGYKSGCVVNNNLDGCMDLPATCAARQKSENCEIETGVNEKCQWNSTGSGSCIDIKCENAHLVSLSGGVTQGGCWGYKGLKCVINSAGNGCVARPKTCTGLVQDACNQSGVVEGNKSCYWDLGSTTCKDIGCSSITFANGATINHAACQGQNTSCTVNLATSPTGCIALKPCTQYTFAEQCQKDADDVLCKFIPGVGGAAGFCIYQPCADADDSDSRDTDGECQTFSTRCTVAQKKCAIKKATCAEYKNQGACLMHTIGGTLCAWSGTACADVSGTPTCAEITGVGLTAEYCQQKDATCSVKADLTSCLTAEANCSGYDQPSCKWATTDLYCVWTSAGAGACAAASATKCSLIAGTSASSCAASKSSCTWTTDNTCQANCAAATGPYDYDSCKAFDSDCTVKLDGSACVNIVATCAATLAANCTSSEEGFCYMAGSTCTAQTGTPLAANSCSTVTGGTRLTPSYCKGISTDGNVCSVNAAQTACVEVKANCADYGTTDCFSGTTETTCVIAGGACAAFTDTCAGIIIEGLTTYTNYHCKKFKATCQAKADGSGCEDAAAAPAPTCTDFTGTGLTYYYCNGMLNTCSVNANRTACVARQNTCQAYSLLDCGYAANEGECMVLNGACVQKGCDSAAQSITAMGGCQSHSANCVLRVGGCVERATCASYLTSGACVKNSTGGDCLWNATAGVCVDKSCAAAEATANYDSHNKCAALGKCTVKATALKTTGQGCIPQAACSSYTIQEQCKVNVSQVPCVWNDNDAANPVCADKSCATAPLSTATHQDCQTYLGTCTVDVVDVNGTPTPKGCIILKPCSQYAEAQCHLSSEKTSANAAIECAWNGTACANKSCATAQSTVNTHALCSGYWTECTVNSTNDGCVPIPEKCEGMSKDQCFDGAVDSKSKKCFWVDDTTGCVTRTCENSPNYASETECDTYLSGCTTDAVKCKTKICEDFPLTTDALCKAALSSCTSNGSICVSRGTCAQAQSEAGCVVDTSNRLCQWMTPATGTAYCTIRTCNTAPNTLTTEEQCKQYFTPSSGTCTTKKDGGCVVKGACTAATVEAACKTDNTGADCWWDTDRCRLKECKDFSGTTHAACNKIKSNCTVGLSGKCALMANCEATTVRAACIQGNNGPCLWVGGACYSYESCKSLDWTSDSQCKLISPSCTTNGTECVGITSCAETNVSGGCKTGTDGQCIQTLSAKGAADTICKKYTSCDAAYYLTHDECQVANPNCTSDYANGCIPLAACSAYTKPGQCNFNKDGAITDANGGITSTGNCQWDETAAACRDQQCKDITLTTEYECASILKTCSTDGTTCIVKGACSSYTTDAACNKAGGTEGACFWVVATDTAAASCRTKTCADIPNGTSTAACQGVTSCVSNGTNCIVKATCATYTTKTGCQSSGTDGLCVWTDPVAPATVGKCALMTGCVSAKDDVTCNQANNRCSWNSTTKVCAEHTCDTYKTQVGSCRYFYTWDMKKYNICSTVSGKCVATDAATLPEGDCYTLTAYQYSWNPTSSKCAQCGTVVPEPNNSNNSNSTTNGTTTDSGYILAWTSAVVAYLII